MTVNARIGGAIVASILMAGFCTSDAIAQGKCVNVRTGVSVGCDEPGAVSIEVYNESTLRDNATPEITQPAPSDDDGIPEGVVIATVVAVVLLAALVGVLLWRARRRDQVAGAPAKEPVERPLAPTAATRPSEAPPPAPAARRRVEDPAPERQVASPPTSRPAPPSEPEPAPLAAAAPAAPSAPPGWYPDPTQPQTQRFWDGNEWTEQRAPLGTTSPSPASLTGPPTNVVAVSMAILGLLIAVVGVFLPRAESDAFIKIAENSLIQNGDGIFVLVFAAFGAAGAYAASRASSFSIAVVIDGLLIIGFAIYAGTGDRLELTSISPLGDGSTSQGTPGIGIWAVGIGGALITLAGMQRAVTSQIEKG